MRIASLLASGTELVVALGAGGSLVGRSHECDHPAWVKELPVLSTPTFDVLAPSAEIDRQVRTKLHNKQPLYTLDETKLAHLAPDVLITQTHCEVCAVSPSATGACLVRTQVSALAAGDVKGILAGYREVARVISRVAEAEAMIAAIEQRIADARSAAAHLPRPSVVTIEWLSPVFVSGNWVPELVEIAGGREVLGEARARSTVASWEAVCAADPEVLIIAPCGFDVERTMSELPTLTELPGFAQLQAVRNRRCFVADGNLYFNRSGPNLFATLDVLQQMLYPHVFPGTLQGKVWRFL